MNYKKLYDTLYLNGYHEDGTNIGKGLVEYLTDNFEFKTILDIGCSQGYAVQEYINKDKKAYGIDISEIAIEKAHSLDIMSCFQGSVTSIPFSDNMFEAVVTSDVLEHLEEQDIKIAIKEILRVATKYLFIKVSHLPEGNKKWINFLHENKLYENIDNLHVSVFPFRKWKEMFEETGKVKFLKKEHKILIFEVIK